MYLLCFKVIKFILLDYYITLLGVQLYENMNTAHGAGWGNGCLVLPILLHRYLVKYGLGGVTFLTHIHSNGCIYRGTWANMKRNFSSVSQGVYIANMVILCIKLIFGVNTFKNVNRHFTFK